MGWSLIVWGAGTSAVCAVIAALVATAVKAPPSFRPEFIVGSSFCNSLTAPLVMMQTLCRQDPFLSIGYGEDGSISCEDRSTTYIFVYTIGWMLLFFGIGYPWILTLGPSSMDAEPPAALAASRAGAVREVFRKVFNPCMVACWIGYTIGVISPVQDEFFSSDGRLLWASSAATTLGLPTVGLFALLVGATLGNTGRRWLYPDKPPGKKRLYSDTEVPADRGGFGFAAAQQQPQPDEVRRPSTRVVGAFVFTRMVLCPAVTVALIYTLSGAVLTANKDETKLAQLVMILEAVVPSADTVIATVTMAGRTVGSEALAVAYLWQYLFGAVSLTAGTAFGMAWLH